MASQVFSALKARIILILMIAILVFALASIKTLFREGMILGRDHPFHMLNCYFTTLYMLPSFNILGWDPYNNYGLVFNQYYDAGTNILISLIYYASLEQLNIFDSYKVAFALAYVLMAPVTYLFIYSISKDKMAGLVGALLSIIVFPAESSLFDAGLRQMYETGMWPERFGNVLCFFGLALLILSFEEKSLSKRLLTTAWTSVIFAWTVLTHVVAGLSLASLAAVGWLLPSLHDIKSAITESKDGIPGMVTTILHQNRRKTFSYLSVWALSIGLCAFWTIPLLETLEKFYSFPAISSSGGTDMLVQVFQSLPWYVLGFYVIGAATPFLDRRQIRNPLAIVSLASVLLLQILSLVNPNDKFVGTRLVFSALFSLIYYLTTDDYAVGFSLTGTSLLLLLSTGPSTHVIDLLIFRLDLSNAFSVVASFGYSKFASVARLVIVILSSIGFSRLASFLYAHARTAGSKREFVPVVYSIVLGFMIFLFLNFQISTQMENTDLNYPWSQQINLKLSSDFRLVSQADSLISWIKQNGDSNSYILMQDILDIGDWMGFPKSHYLYLTPVFTGKPIVGGVEGSNYITNPISTTDGGQILSMPISRIVGELGTFDRLLGELGIGHVVVFDIRLIKAMNASSLFRLSYYDGLFAVFRRAEPAYIASVQNAGEILEATYEINAMSFKVSGAEGNSSLRIRAVDYPGWSAKVNGESTEIHQYRPKIQSVMNWKGVVVPDYEVPFIEISLPAGQSRVVLDYHRSTAGDSITGVSLVLFAAFNLLGSAVIVKDLYAKSGSSLKHAALKGFQ